MTVAEMKISNRERLNKLEALDPEKLNDILDIVFSKYYYASKNELTEVLSSRTTKESEADNKGNYPPYFGIWKDNGDEIKELIYKSRTKNKEIIL